METALIGLLALLASMVGTLTGFGTSTIMVPILLQFYPLEQTLLFVGIIHWFGDIWKLVLFRSGIKLRLILYFGGPGILAAALGAQLLLDVPGSLMPRILGGFLVGYVVILFVKGSFKIKQSNAMAALGGTVSGFLAGLFGIGGAVRAMFLTAFDLPKAVYIATAGAIALAVDSSRLTTYLVNGVRIDSLLLPALAVSIPASFIGARIAKTVVQKIPQSAFRKVIAVFLLLLAGKLLLFG